MSNIIRVFPLRRLLVIFLFITLIILPGFIFADETETEEKGFWDRFLGVFTDPLAALTNLIANVLAIVALVLTGVVPVLAIAAGIAYLSMVVLGLLATGLFIITKWLILNTMSIPVVPGAGVDVVTKGWEFSRDFVSLLFIVILVFIGLATILRWREYQFQKTLPLLLIMALLVNFSGVVVGFVVDVGNLITFSLINSMGEWGGGILEIIKVAVDDLLAVIRSIPENLFTKDPLTFFTETLIQPTFGAIAKALFFVFFTLTLLLVLILFIIRVGVLWILTILAPFAFAAYILPATRELWTRWWKSLIQWAFMGVPIAFFLLLSVQIASISIVPEVEEEAKWFANILATLIQPLFIMLFLVVGLLISFTWVPKGAQFVTSAAQRGFKAAGQTAGKRAWGATKTRTAKMPVVREAQMGWIKARASGQSITKALGESIKRGWGARSRIPTTKREMWTAAKAPVKEIWAARKGTTSAFGASLKAGWKAAIKAKKQKKGFECPRCKYKQSKDNDFCESCGFMF